MTDSSEMGDWQEVDSISEPEDNTTSQNQLEETPENKSQEESKDKSPETELQQKESISYCSLANMSGGTRLIVILIVILILQRITAGTDLFC